MSQKKYIVNLSDAEVNELETLLRTGKHSARMLTRARILLQVHEGQTDQAIAENLRVNRSTVERTREKYVFADSLTSALKDRPHPRKPRKLDASAEAFLIATACSDAPERHSTWTMQQNISQRVTLRIPDELLSLILYE